MLKNITLSAEKSIIQKARAQAAQEMTTINALFRQWLARYVGRRESGNDYDELMQRMAHVKPGRAFSREQMNER